MLKVLEEIIARVDIRDEEEAGGITKPMLECGSADVRIINE